MHNIYRSGVLQKTEIRAVAINQTNKWRKGANNIPPEIGGGGYIPGKQFNVKYFLNILQIFNVENIM